jgi:hypothetical protein
MGCPRLLVRQPLKRPAARRGSDSAPHTFHMLVEDERDGVWMQHVLHKLALRRYGIYIIGEKLPALLETSAHLVSVNHPEPCRLAA